jgi:UDP-N-acetylglucosamine diphosphorylase/glucosamine-1-phosphate N-acetyltransferase
VTAFVLYDDAIARGFEPFALTRPAGELRAGALLTRERWARLLGLPCAAFISGAHLAEFAEFDAPPAATDAIAAGSWLVNARSAPALGAAAITSDPGVIRVGGRVAAVRLRDPVPLTALGGGETSLDALASGRSVEVAGWWLEEVWDLVGRLDAMLASDALALMPSQTSAGALTVLGAHPVHAEADARVEPFVVVDASAGPVLIRARAHVQAFTRLVGPCVIGEDAVIVGGRVSGCSIGPRAKISGEISATIVIGHANKGHDGFVGHSVIAPWANLGAGTITSNLKNSYGEVALWTPRGVRATGLQFLGALVGEHAKLGIGTRLTTGCVVGAGANVYGTRMPPKAVPPFAWGDGEPWSTFEIERFLTVASRVMARRGVALSAGSQRQWRAAFDARWTP